MLSKEEIEKAKSNILRGNDIESACLIMEAVVWDGLVQVGGRVNITKVAMRQILNFVEEYKNKGSLEIIREKVQANERSRQLETKEQKLIERLEEIYKKYNNEYKRTDSMELSKINVDLLQELSCIIQDLEEILSIIKGEKK